MSRYDRVVALIKPRQVNIVNANGLKLTTVVQRVAAQLAGKKFNSHSHVQCWLHFKVRPSTGSPDPGLCNPQFCSYDVLHKDYIYTQAWVDFLVAKLNDPATYQVVMGGAQ